MGEGPSGAITSATSTTGETGEAVEYSYTDVEGGEVTITIEYGAEAFGSARGLAASLAAVASAALVFAQWTNQTMAIQKSHLSSFEMVDLSEVERIHLRLSRQISTREVVWL